MTEHIITHEQDSAGITECIISPCEVERQHIGFTVEGFVAEARRASCTTEPEVALSKLQRVQRLLEETMASTADVRRIIPNTGPDEVLLHEGDDCTVYIVRVPPGETRVGLHSAQITLPPRQVRFTRHTTMGWKP